MKKTLRIISISIFIIGLILAVVGCTVGKGTPPVPGNSGIITISNLKSTSLTLNWTKAQDDNSAQKNIEYRAYYATVSSITSPENVEANAIPVGEWEKEIEVKDITNLNDLTDYYFTILVRDEKGNTTIYNVIALFAVTLNFSHIPAGAQSIEVSIKGDNLEDINKSFPVESQAEIMVPSGKSILFSAETNLTSVSFKGEKEQDLLNKTEAEIPIQFNLYETKLVIPDAENNRIVQMDDMTGAGWTTLTWNDLGFSNYYEFAPYDIDFDSQGRIYIANYYNNSEDRGLIRIDDINDTTSDTIISSRTKALAIDRANGWIYYPDGNQISRCDYDGNNQKQYSMSFGDIRGMAVDNQGMVYIAFHDEGDVIVKDLR